MEGDFKIAFLDSVVEAAWKRAGDGRLTIEAAQEEIHFLIVKYYVRNAIAEPSIFCKIKPF